MNTTIMTKGRVRQYRKLKKEIDLLNERIAKCDEQIIFDTVQGSVGVGHQKRNILVTGNGNPQLPRLYTRKREREAECAAIEMFVDSVEDSVMWQLLTRRYLDGCTIQETADLMNYSTVHVGRLIDNFFEKMMSNDDK